MKKNINNLYLTLLLCLFAGLMSCSKPIVLEESDLLGSWKSENMRINGIPASEYASNPSYYQYALGLQKDNFYHLNYSAGEWSILNNNELYLSNRGTFKIISFRENRFTIEGEMDAAKLNWAFEGLFENETLVITEDYYR
ncbi:MAG: hypothetical protein P1U56_05290 [Saprospiraceae bacterium]|nr:hypothetical protein [Saprospiraceae bacterium]